MVERERAVISRIIADYNPLRMNWEAAAVAAVESPQLGITTRA